MKAIKLQERRPQTWYNAKISAPDDDRDVLAQVWKLITVDKQGKPVFNYVMEVVIYSNGHWWYGNMPANVMQWTELPTGWIPKGKPNDGD